MFFRSAEKPKPSYSHPLDPSVDREYELLVHSWKEQLVQSTPTTPKEYYTRYAWLQLMDHYLDQQWLDSKQMLQCAQAWSGRESISLPEAIHTMNILSLKFMQRSLDTRKELLNTLNDPDLMMALGIPPSSSPCNMSQGEAKGKKAPDGESFHSIDIGKEVRNPLLPTEEDNNVDVIEEKEEEEENNNSDIEEETSQTSTREDEDEDDDKDDSDSYDDDSANVVQKRQALDECESIRASLLSDDIKKRRSFFDDDGFGLQNCLRYSRSTPNFSLEMKLDRDSQATLSINKNVQITQYRSDESSICSSNGSSQSEFFLHSRDGPIDRTTNFFTIRQSTLYKAGFADEKVETDNASASTDIYSNQRLCVPNQDQFNMVNSESSIKVFEPNGNTVEGRTDVLLNPNNYASPTMVKSISFPTKEALLEVEDKKNTVNKERNFMLRSIVNKKPSFSKFFGVKKG